MTYIRLKLTSALAFAVLSGAVGGCAMMAAPTGTISRDAAARSGDWHDVATEADRQRIRGWWQAWADGLASARAHGDGAAITAEGALLEPAAALPNPHLPPGDYACRVIKLGTPAGSTLAYVAYPRFRCRVAAEHDNDRRKIFLGTLMLGDETRALDYGADAERNLAGLVERIGPNRWRIVFPRPAFESMIDVMELVPEA